MTAAGRYRCPADQAIRLAHTGTQRLAAVQLAERALSSNECVSDARCVRHAVLALAYAGDLPSAEAHCAAAQSGADASVRQTCTLLGARVRYLTGHCTEAHETISGLLREPLQPSLRGFAVSWLVEILVQRDELDHAESFLADLRSSPAVLAARAAVHLAADRSESAVDEYLECGRRLSKARILNPAVVAWRSRAALAALTTHRVDLAMALAHDELLAARRWGSSATVGAALHPLALLQADDHGVDLLADAVRLLDVARTRGDQIWALYDLGLMLRKRHDDGAARATLLLANRLARWGGNTRWSRRTRAVLDNLLAPVGGAALTRQEARIARLAAAGHSNKQIAAQLSLTVRTVEFHLSGAYRKLGISGRRELGAVVATLF